MKEIWKDIEGYEKLYQASSLGRIRSIDRTVDHSYTHSKRKFIRGKIIKPSENGRGYLMLNLCKNGKLKGKSVHRLILETFIERTDNSLECNHINGNKEDNRAINLEWCTRGQNIKHAYDLGLRKRPIGDDSPNSKLTELAVRVIQRAKGDFSQRELAKCFNVTKRTISLIHRGLIWKHLKNDYHKGDMDAV